MGVRRVRARFVALATLMLGAGTIGYGQDVKIATGAYSIEQAEQGRRVFDQNCANCHRTDLQGDRGPALVGDRFFSSWQAGPVARLFSKIKESMPPGNRNLNISDADYIALVSFILQSNAFPPHRDDVPLTAGLLEELVVPSRAGEKNLGPPNFAMVQVVGCLSQGPDRQWRLTRSTPAALTKDAPLTPQELQEGQKAALGSGTFVLHSVAPFKPEAHQGQKMAARGLVYTSPTDSLISLSSLQVVDTTCGS
jgi:mono/diheme cytochrome c family protein